jgi:ribose 5-phosphate isomerase B
MHIYIGSDHAGYNLKKDIKKYIDEKEGYDITDLGSFSEESVDYPDIVREVTQKVLEYPKTLGIVICGTGQGSCMTANKERGIRAALCTNEYLAQKAREHNHANVLCMGERVTGTGVAKGIVDRFLGTDIDESERHVRRVKKIEKKQI